MSAYKNKLVAMFHILASQAPSNCIYISQLNSKAFGEEVANIRALHTA
jgi:hypothetical protein